MSPLSTYNGYEYFDMDYEPEDWSIDHDDIYNHAALEVEILVGLTDIWVTFRDEYDVDNKLRGRVYRNPRTASLHRLYKVLSTMQRVKITIEPDDRSPIIYARRLYAFDKE